MNTNFKKTMAAAVALLLTDVLCFAFVGCADYNDGYEQLYAYIEENNVNEPGDSALQAYATFEGIDRYDAYVLFTVTQKGNTIHASCNSRTVIEGESSYDLSPDGFSETAPIEIEVRTDRIGDYYYKGTTTLGSPTQSTFVISNIQYSTSIALNYKDVPISLQSTVRTALETVLKYTFSMFKSALDDELGIPLGSFYNES